MKPIFTYTLIALGSLLASELQAPNLSALSNLASLGFAVWYGWYITTRTIPRMARDGRETIAVMEAAHERQLTKMADTFTDTVRILVAEAKGKQ